MDWPSIIIVGIVTPVLITVLIGLGKMILEIKSILGADQVKWEQNSADHKKAFAEIATLKTGQLKIEKKLDHVAWQVDKIVGEK